MVMMMINSWVLGKKPRGQKYTKLAHLPNNPGAYEEVTTCRNLLRKDLNEKYLKVEEAYIGIHSSISIGADINSLPLQSILTLYWGRSKRNHDTR